MVLDEVTIIHANKNAQKSHPVRGGKRVSVLLEFFEEFLVSFDRGSEFSLEFEEVTKVVDFQGVRVVYFLKVLYGLLDGLDFLREEVNGVCLFPGWRVGYFREVFVVMLMVMMMVDVFYRKFKVGVFHGVFWFTYL